MGSIHPYSTAKGEKLYRVAFRRPDNTQSNKRGFKTKKEAAAFLLSVEHSKSIGDFVDPAASRVTVGQLSPLWLTTRTHLKASSYRSIESAWKTHVGPMWTGRSIRSIKKSEVQAWTSQLGRERGATTVKRCAGVLAGILQMAVDDRMIRSNPATGLKLPKKTPARKVYLTHEQVHALAAASRKHSTLIYTLAYTGMRWGELSALRVRELNLLHRRVGIVDNAVDVGGTIHFNSPKSNRHRSISMPSYLVAKLETQIADRGPDDFVFGNGTTPVRLPHSEKGWLAYAVRRCQKLDPTFPRITAHSLRHTAASLATSVQRNPKLVQNMLGHASAAHTLDIYADLFPDDMDRLADGLDEAIANSAVVTPLSRKSS